MNARAFDFAAEIPHPQTDCNNLKNDIVWSKFHYCTILAPTRLLIT